MIFHSQDLIGKHYVYCMLCRDGIGPVYVKFGHSCNVLSRMNALITGCPIPAKTLLYIQLNNRASAIQLEKELHLYFKKRKIRGEWFKFDYSSKMDKEEFNHGCKFAINLYLKGGSWWTRINISELKKYNKEKQRNYFLNTGKKKINRIKAAEKLNRYIDKELRY